MNLISHFLTMKDSELREAYEEFRNHEKSGVLNDGIIRKLADEIGGSANNIFEVEYAFLREATSRWYHNI